MTIRACPVCERAAIAAFRPFCSVRCQDEDLRRWLAGEYRIPSRPGIEGEDDDAGLEEDGR